MVAVVIPTFEGEAYIASQIESILNQTHPDIRIYIRDDGSRDCTLEIINHYARIYERIVLVRDSRKHLGVTRSIKILLSRVSENVVFLADQDDVWVPSKISVMLDMMPDNGLGSVPTLIFSDLEVVDEQLRTISGSFWDMSGINIHRLKFRDIIRRNCVTGCAAAMNRAMLELLKNMPDSAVHDWWAACLAAHSGVLVPIKEPLVKYRQHGFNVIGAQKRGINRIVKLVRDSCVRKKYSQQLQNSATHLRAMISCFPYHIGLAGNFFLKKEILKRNIFLFLVNRF